MSDATAATRADMLQRARDLAPTLFERAFDTNALRRVPDDLIGAVADAGFFRMLQPKRWGGLELPPGAFFDAQLELATACPPTAWVLGVVGVHAWQLALFDEQAQQDVWGDDSGTLISSSYMPVGKVTRVDGGFRLSGRWSFSSGSDHCQWAFLGAFVPTEGGPPDMRTFLVPRSDYEIIDVWRTSGLSGTGSNDIVVDDAFVPEHRTHRFGDAFKLDSPGNATNPGALYRVPFGQIFVRTVSTPAIGMARGALAAFREATTSRVSQATGAKVKENARSQVVCAQAAAAIDAATAVLHRNMDELMACAEAGDKPTLERRVQFRYESTKTVLDLVPVVDDIFTASGGRAIWLDNPINRYWQDIHACRAHFANNPDKPGTNWGGLQLGFRNTDYFI